MRGWPRSSAPTRFRAVRASASRKSRKVFFSLLFSTHRGPDKWSRQLRTLSSFDIAPKCLALISHRALFAVDHSPTKFPFLSSFVSFILDVTIGIFIFYLATWSQERWIYAPATCDTCVSLRIDINNVNLSRVYATYAPKQASGRHVLQKFQNKLKVLVPLCNLNNFLLRLIV